MTTTEAKYLETFLKRRGYKKYNQKLHSSTFQYYKDFDSYLIGFLFYDWRNYPAILHEDFGISAICLLNCDKRIELIYGYENETISEFEGIAKEFYESMKKYKQ